MVYAVRHIGRLGIVIRERGLEQRVPGRHITTPIGGGITSTPRLRQERLVAIVPVGSSGWHYYAGDLVGNAANRLTTFAMDLLHQ